MSWSCFANKTDFRFNTVNQYIGQNGVVSTENGSAGFTVGGREDLANWWQGLISEIIVYNRILTLAETQQVESYLQSKYGITCGVNAVTKPGSGNAAFYPGTGSYPRFCKAHLLTGSTVAEPITGNSPGLSLTASRWHQKSASIIGVSFSDRF